MGLMKRLYEKHTSGRPLTVAEWDFAGLGRNPVRDQYERTKERAAKYAALRANQQEGRQVAGSYGHCTNRDGSFRLDLVENLGDCGEALEEMWQMIQFREDEEKSDEMTEDTRPTPLDDEEHHLNEDSDRERDRRLDGEGG